MESDELKILCESLSAVSMPVIQLQRERIAVLEAEVERLQERCELLGNESRTVMEAEVERLRTMLKSIEWVADPSYPDWHFCPSCDATSDCMLSLKHTDNCKLHAALEK